LLDNIAINNLSARVTALNNGLSDQDGELTFTTAENCTNHVIANGEQSAGTISVPVCRLDSVLLNESPTVMKIDTEGFEAPVIDGAQATLSNPSLHSVIMELNGSGQRYGFDDETILRRMAGHGFSTFEYDPFSRQLRSLHGKKNPNLNTLFLRNEDHLKERIAQAQPISIAGSQF
jgi:FkbM family methyltransferase